MIGAVSLRLAAAIDAVGRLPGHVRAEVFGDTWRHLRATRNRIAHAYQEVSHGTVRLAITHDLDLLEETLLRLEALWGHP